jgi:hypothetical protein
VSITVSELSAALRTDSLAFRKKTVAAVGACESVPEATMASRPPIAAKPELRSCDHCMSVVLPAEVIERDHDWVALMLSARPSVGVRLDDTIAVV